MSHPEFKLSWLKDGDEKLKARQYLCSRIAGTAFTTKGNGPVSQNSLYDFNEATSPSKDEIDSYLSDKDKALSMLDRHPAIKQVFVRYNTAVPSSAPVERLFSVASLILTAKRNRLSDRMFEYLLLLKIHKNI